MNSISLKGLVSAPAFSHCGTDSCPKIPFEFGCCPGDVRNSTSQPPYVSPPTSYVSASAKFVSMAAAVGLVMLALTVKRRKKQLMHYVRCMYTLLFVRDILFLCSYMFLYSILLFIVHLNVNVSVTKHVQIQNVQTLRIDVVIIVICL